MVERVLHTLDELLQRVEQVEKDLIIISKENTYLKDALVEMYKKNKELVKGNVGKKRSKYS